MTISDIAGDNPIVVSEEINAAFCSQQAAYRELVNPSLEERREDLRSLYRLLKDNAHALVEAVNQDFGCRSVFETNFTELFLAQNAALTAIKELGNWIKPRKRRLDPMQFPLASAWTFPQPIGVVGIVVPWNFPIAMTFQPLISAFAAGNRAMVKMSENSNRLAALLKTLSPKYFPLDKLAFFEDGGGCGPAFTALPFDHLFFTGSSTTGKAVMANAARNLTPVTLELGGKSPCVVAPDFPIRTAAERIIWAKALNAGQICTNVDYLFLPEGKTDEFIRHARTWFNAHYPDINSGDYTSIIDQRSYDRILVTATDARDKGAQLIDLYEGPAADQARRIVPPRLLLNVRDDMTIMRREIFGPLLPIITYRSEHEVVDYVNARPRPLAFYIFSNDAATQRHYLNHTISGGVGINEAIVQAGIHDLPFGGTGNSGMGHYHAYEGFLTFSKLRPVFSQGPIRGLDFFLPPYAGRPSWLLNLLFKLRG